MSTTSVIILCTIHPEHTKIIPPKVNFITEEPLSKWAKTYAKVGIKLLGHGYNIAMYLNPSHNE
jgi:hypothetical protein